MNFKFLLGLALIIPFAYAAEDNHNRKRPQRPQGQELVPEAKRQETLSSSSSENPVLQTLQDDEQSVSSSSSSSSSNELAEVRKYAARIYKTLRQHGSSAKKITKNPVLECTKIGNIDFVEFLLNAGFEAEIKNNDGNTPLHLASRLGQLEIAKCLVEAGADIEVKNNKGWTPLHYASRDGVNSDGQPETFGYLIAIGADKEAKDNEGCTPLHHASYTRQLHVVDRLIRAGADVKVKNNNDMTPLHFVSQWGHYCVIALCDVIEDLLKAGADIEAKDNKGMTPLLYASHEGRLEVVKHLVKAGADKEAKTKNGWTSLMIACCNGYLEIVKCLLAAGADKEVKSKYGSTPLIIASRKGQLEVAKCLIEQGVGVTPLHMKEAASKNKTDVLSYLMHTSGKYSDQAECSICLNLIEEHPKTTACCFGAIYCMQCICQAAEHKNACPTCRAPGVQNKLIDIQETMAHYVPEVSAGTSASGAMLPSCSSSDMHD